MEHDMIDTAAELCQSDVITQPFPENGNCAAVALHGSNAPEFSSKRGRGGARPNSGGPRPNSGGARPNSGPKPKPKPITTYASNDPQWCVYAVWGQAETSAATELTRQGYNTYTPLEAIRRRDRVVLTMWHTVRVPLIPGYGFIRMPPASSREPILATRGVREVLLRPDGRPYAVPDTVIEALRANDEARLKLPAQHGPVLAVGASVRVEEGAFAGRSGAVIECDGLSTLVEVAMFGRLVPIWMDRVAVLEV